MRLTAEMRFISPEAAHSLLLERLEIPTRASSQRTKVAVAYRYLKRSFSHCFETLAKTAVKAYVAKVNELKGLTHDAPVSGSSSRLTLELSAEDAACMRTADRFMREMYGHMGILARLTAIFEYLGAGERFLEPAEPGQTVKVVACMLAHYALGATKIRAHLRLRAAGGPAPDT